jgi:hypothetical protein
MSSTELNTDDMSVYHPHDLLIAQFFPDEDIFYGLRLNNVLSIVPKCTYS